MKVFLISLCFIVAIAQVQTSNNRLRLVLPICPKQITWIKTWQTGLIKKDSTHKFDEVPRHVLVENGCISHRYSCDSIWGTRREGKDWHISNYREYNMIYNGKACVYLRPTKTDFSQPGLTRFETTFFSPTLDSPVYPLTQENLSLVFSGTPSYMKKITALSASYNVAKKDKATGTYEFTPWL